MGATEIPAEAIEVPAEEPVKETGEAFVHPLDLLGDEKEMAELERVLKQETPAVELSPTAEPETPDPVGDPPADPAPAKDMPAADPAADPAAKEAAPPVEPAKTDPPKHKPRPQFWSQMREAQRKVKEDQERVAKEREELEAEKRRLAGDAVDPSELDDPLTKMERELAEIKARELERDQKFEKITQQTAAQLEAERDQRAILDEVREFERTNPDYIDALNHLVESRREELDDLGVIDSAAEQWLLKYPDHVKRHATDIGKNPEAEDELYEAARDVAFKVLLDNERQLIIKGARTRNEKVPEVVYRNAVRRGYRPADAPAPAAAAPTPAKAAEQARDRVRTAMQAQATTQSLSAVRNGGVPKGREIKTKDDIMNLTEAEIMRLDQEQPGWDKAIFERGGM